MEELIDFLDTHPEVKPLLSAQFLEFAAQTPGLAEALIPTLKKKSDELREQLAESIERRIPAWDAEFDASWEYSDTLLVQLLKGAKPEKYRDRQEVKHDGQIDMTVKAVHQDAEA